MAASPRSPQPQFEVPESRSGRSRSPAAAPREEESKTEGGSAAAAAEGAAAAASSSAEGSSSKADRKRDGSSSKNSPSKHSPAKDHHRSSRHKHSDRRSRSRDRDRRSSRDRSSRDRRSRSRSRSLDRHRSSRRHHRDSRSRSRSRSRRSRSRSSRSRARRSSRSRSYESRSRSRSRDRRSKYDPTSIRSALGTVEPNSLIQSQMATQNPQITRVARRLYVGNLPAASGLTEGMISDLFRTTVVALGIATPNPILSVWLSAEQTFCFVEFRAVQDCSLALTLLQGIQIMGRTLRVGRPADYKPLPPHLANYVVGNPMGVGAPPPTFATNIPFMTALTQGRSPLTDPIVMAMLANPPPVDDLAAAAAVAAAAAPAAASAALPPLDPAAAFSPGTPSRVVLLENMVTLSDLSDDDAFSDLLIDIEEECEKHGKLAGVVIPRPIAAQDDQADKQASSQRGPRVPLGQGTGRIFVRYEQVESAVAAQAKLHGRSFEGHRVVASFYPEDKLAQQQFV